MAVGGGMTMPVDGMTTPGEPMAPMMDSPTISPSYSESPVMDSFMPPVDTVMPPTGDREVSTSGVATRFCMAGALLAVVVALA